MVLKLKKKKHCKFDKKKTKTLRSNLNLTNIRPISILKILNYNNILFYNNFCDEFVSAYRTSLREYDNNR